MKRLTLLVAFSALALGSAVQISQGKNPEAYESNGSGSAAQNGGLDGSGGFTDITSVKNKTAHHYTFTFAPGVNVTNFSLHMLDFGDANPTKETDHFVSLIAYDANGVLISTQQLSYATNEHDSTLYGDLLISGDAISAKPGEPGNWTWNVSGNGIAQVVLDFGVGFDPKIGFDLLFYTTLCQE